MMPTLDINFAQPCRRFNQQLMLLLAILLTVFLGALLHQQQSLTQQIAAKTYANKLNNTTKPEATSSPTLLHSIALAHETQHALNLAWLPLLKELEQVQQANPEIKLLSIQPNPSKADIVITGQTAKFDDLVQYQNSLHTNGLGEAVLVNQRTDVLNNNAGDQNTSKQIIGFTIAVGWKP